MALSYFSSNQNLFSSLEDGEESQKLRVILVGLWSWQWGTDTGVLAADFTQPGKAGI